MRRPRLDLRGAVAVVTGAAGGIGRALAVVLAERGASLALVDRDADGLAQTARQLDGARASRHVLDVTDADGVTALPGAVLGEHGRVTVLVNNAGTSVVGRAHEVSDDELRWLFDVNFFAVASLTRAFLPALQAQPQAAVANVSSVFGLFAPAEQAAYAATKFAVRGWSEALRHELEDTGVAVTVVHPGGVKTGIAAASRVAAAADPAWAAASTARFQDKALRLAPEKAAETVVRAIERRRPRVLVGADARLADVVQRAAPGRYWAAVRGQFKRVSVDR